MIRAIAAVVTLALLLAVPARASEQHPTLDELEHEVMCPTCKTLLALSDASAADRIRVFIRERIAAGDTKSEIEDKLVAQFGEQILASPPKKGFNLLVWVLPFAGLAAAGTAVGLIAWRSARRSRDRPAALAIAEGALDPALEARVDEELRRFDE